MQQYIIKEFKVIESDTTSRTRIYTKDEASGNYITPTTGNLPATTKSLMDFICLPNSSINSVLRQINGNISQETFIVGDLLNGANIAGIRSNIVEIVTIQIILGKVKLVLPNGTFVNLEEAIKYVEPIKKEPIKRSKKQQEDLFKPILDQIVSTVRPLRLTATLRKRNETPEEFLIKFFKEWNLPSNDPAKSTLFVDTGEVQTECGKRRSLGDIYMILKYYYSDITLNEVIKLLYVVLPTKITQGFRSCKCSQIRKKVWHYRANDPNNDGEITANDEYGNTMEYYKTNVNNE